MVSRIILAVVAVVILIGAIVVTARKQPEKANEESSTPIRSLGPETAPVTITEYVDFACITCKVWHGRGIVAQIINKYGDQVRFVWRDFPVITSGSPKTTEAGFCANDQDNFW